MEITDILSKELRNIIYKKTLIEYEKSVNEHNSFGICWALRCVLKTMKKELNVVSFFDLNHYLSLDCYPEILEQQPSTIYGNGTFWFSIIETAPRIDILKKAIKQTS